MLLVLGVVDLSLCFLEFAKDSDLLSIFTTKSNLFVVFGIYKVLVHIRSSVEALLSPVVTCIFLYTKRCGKNKWLVGSNRCSGYSCTNYQPPYPYFLLDNIVFEMKKWANIYIFIYLFFVNFMAIEDLFFYTLYLRVYIYILTRFVRSFEM